MGTIDLTDDVTIEDISHQPLIKALISQSIAFDDGFIRVQPFGCVFPKKMESYLKKIVDFHVKDDDVWISSFPKCGTTWLQETVWCVRNKADVEKAKSINLDDRVPFFEYTCIAPILPDDYPCSLSQVERMPSPRTIKTHLPYDMLPRQCAGKKIIYIARNPRDVCISFYNHWRVLEGYSGTFEDFADLFLGDVCGYYTPFMKHVIDYWNVQHLNNVLFLTYEEMKNDICMVIRKLSEFLDVQLDEDQVKILEEHLSFANMKGNIAVNKQDEIEMLRKIQREKFGRESAKGEFMNKGAKGNWKNVLSHELLARFQRWEEEGMHGSDLKFIYE